MVIIVCCHWIIFYQTQPLFWFALNSKISSNNACHSRTATHIFEKPPNVAKTYSLNFQHLGNLRSPPGTHRIRHCRWLSITKRKLKPYRQHIVNCCFSIAVNCKSEHHCSIMAKKCNTTGYYIQIRKLFRRGIENHNAFFFRASLNHNVVLLCLVVVLRLVLVLIIVLALPRPAPSTFLEQATVLLLSFPVAPFPATSACVNKNETAGTCKKCCYWRVLENDGHRQMPRKKKTSCFFTNKNSAAGVSDNGKPKLQCPPGHDGLHLLLQMQNVPWTRSNAQFPGTPGNCNGHGRYALVQE